MLTPTGHILWARTYDRGMVDVLNLQSDLALDIANQVQVKLTPEEHTRLIDRRAIDPEAYQACLKGRVAWPKYTPEGFREAERQFRRAIEIAPDYAPAWAGLADAFYGMSNTQLPPNDAIPKARAAAAKALALDPDLAEAHTSNGIIKLVCAAIERSGRASGPAVGEVCAAGWKGDRARVARGAGRGIRGGASPAGGARGRGREAGWARKRLGDGWDGVYALERRKQSPILLSWPGYTVWGRITSRNLKLITSPASPGALAPGS